QEVEVAVALEPPHVGEVVARRVGALEGRDHIAVAYEHRRGAVADLRLLGRSRRHRAQVGGRDQSSCSRARLDGVEREPERRGAAAEGAADVGGEHGGRQIHHGGQGRRAPLLRVWRRGRREGAGADAARGASVDGVWGGPGPHGQAVLVVVGDGAVASAARAPDGAEGLGGETVAGYMGARGHYAEHSIPLTLPSPLRGEGVRSAIVRAEEVAAWVEEADQAELVGC